jgi:hypothetical protein
MTNAEHTGATKASRHELMTVGDLIATLAKLDQTAPVALGFLPLEGGHRGADAFEVPFSVDAIEDEGGKLVLVCLTEA